MLRFFSRQPHGDHTMLEDAPCAQQRHKYSGMRRIETRLLCMGRMRLTAVLVAQVAVECHDAVDLALVPLRWVRRAVGWVPVAFGKDERRGDRNVDDATQLAQQPLASWSVFHGFV